MKGRILIEPVCEHLSRKFRPKGLKKWRGRECTKKSFIICTTERRSRVADTFSSYLESPGFTFRPWNWLTWPRYFVAFLIHLGKCWDNTLKLGHDHFLPHPFQFICHHAFFRHSIFSCHWKSVIIHTTNKICTLHQIVFSYVTTANRSRISSGSIVSDYGLDDRAIGVRSPAGAKDFSSSLCVQTGSGAHPASCPMGTGGVLSPRGKARPGRDADHSPPSSAEVVNE
jgi:hypothetical protein